MIEIKKIINYLKAIYKINYRVSFRLDSLFLKNSLLHINNLIKSKIHKSKNAIIKQVKSKQTR